MKRLFIKLFIALFFLTAINLNAQSTYTFTNAGQEGNTGPTQNQVNIAYSGTNLDGDVTVNTQGIQEWVVPTTGIYTIIGKGASGGYTPNALEVNIFIPASPVISTAQTNPRVFGGDIFISMFTVQPQMVEFHTPFYSAPLPTQSC